MSTEAVPGARLTTVEGLIGGYPGRNRRQQVISSSCGLRSPLDSTGLSDRIGDGIQENYSGINCCRRCGSSPSHSGFWAVPSKIDEVLNGSNSPRDAACAVFASRDFISWSLIG